MTVFPIFCKYIYFFFCLYFIYIFFFLFFFIYPFIFRFKIFYIFFKLIEKDFFYKRFNLIICFYKQFNCFIYIFIYKIYNEFVFDYLNDYINYNHLNNRIQTHYNLFIIDWNLLNYINFLKIDLYLKDDISLYFFFSDYAYIYYNNLLEIKFITHLFILISLPFYIIYIYYIYMYIKDFFFDNENVFVYFFFILFFFSNYCLLKDILNYYNLTINYAYFEYQDQTELINKFNYILYNNLLLDYFFLSLNFDFKIDEINSNFFLFYFFFFFKFIIFIIFSIYINNETFFISLNQYNLYLFLNFLFFFFFLKLKIIKIQNIQN